MHAEGVTWLCCWWGLYFVIVRVLHTDKEGL